MMKKTISIDLGLEDNQVVDDFMVVARVLKSDKTQTIIVKHEGDLTGLEQVGLLQVGMSITIAGNQIDE